MKQGCLENLELVGLKKDGSEFPVLVNVSVIKNAEGGPIGRVFTLRDITSLTRVLMERDENLRDLNFLSKLTMEIVEFPAESNIYKFAAEKLQQLVGDAIIAVSVPDKSSNILRPKVLLGLGEYFDTVVAMLGGNLFGLGFRIAISEVKAEMLTGKLKKIPDGLYGACFGQIPKAVCLAVEKLLKVNGAYIVGLRRNKQLFGTILIMPRGGVELRQSTVETFANQVSIILERNEANDRRMAVIKRSAEIVNGMPDALVELDLYGTIVNVNHAYLTLFDVKAEAVIGTHYNKLPSLRPENTGRFNQFLEELIKAGHAEIPEVAFQRSDGKNIPCSINYSTIKNAEGDLQNIVAIIRDITERKRAEEKEKQLVLVAAAAAAERKKSAELKFAQDLLEQERNTLDSIIDLNPYGIQIYNSEGRHIRANKAYLDMFHAVPPADYCFFNDPVAAKLGLGERNQLLKKGEVHVAPEMWYNAHLQYPEQPDRLLCFRSTVFPIMTAESELRYFVVMFEDITERKRAEEDLLSKTLLLQAQLETSVDGIMIVNNAGEVILFNKLFAEIWKIPQNIVDTREEKKIVAYILKQLKDPSGFVHRLTEIYSRKHEKSNDEIEFTDGRCLDRFSGPILDASGKYNGRIWYSRDITKRKEMVAQLVEMGKREAIGYFITGTAHELNNPLAAVIAFSELLIDGLKCVPANTGKLLEAAGIVLRNAVRCEGLVTSLMAYGRTSPVQLALVDINKLAAEALNVAANYGGLEKINIQAHYLAELPPVSGSNEQLTQVFVNIIRNAAAAMHGCGSLEIESKIEDGNVCVRFADSGEGIDAGNLAKVFDPFFTTQGPGQGTGLGLSVSAGIMRVHNGALLVESEGKGKGATFKVLLPIPV